MLRDNQRVRAALAAQRLTALVATTAENVRYLTDYEAPALFIYRYPGAFAVVPVDRDPALIIQISGLEYLIERPVATDHLYTTGTYHVGRRIGAALSEVEERLQALREASPHFPNAQEALVAILREAGAAHGQIGVDENGVSPAVWRSLASALPGATLVEAGAIFAEIRRVKTQEEITLLRRAAEINETAAARAFRVAGEGVPEMHLERTYCEEIARAGAVPGHWETTLGPRSSGSFHAGDYRGRRGDIIRSDSSCRFRGYWSDIGRTRVIGGPSRDHARTYEAIRTGEEAVLGAVKPGARVGDLFRLGVESIRQSGLPEFRRHHIGHGIGLEMYEPPLFVEGSDERLEVGMVINIETPYYESGYGGFQVEDTVLVTPAGCELLTRADRGLQSVGEA